MRYLLVEVLGLAWEEVHKSPEYMKKKFLFVKQAIPSHSLPSTLSRVHCSRPSLLQHFVDTMHLQDSCKKKYKIVVAFQHLSSTRPEQVRRAICQFASEWWRICGTLESAGLSALNP